jgi:hypothetical protein
MEFVVLITMTAMVTVICGFVVLVASLNLGVFPVPEEDQFVRRLYWRKLSAPLTNVISVSVFETVVASDLVVVRVVPAPVTIRAATGSLTISGSAVEKRQAESSWSVPNENRTRIAGESLMIAA